MREMVFEFYQKYSPYLKEPKFWFVIFGLFVFLGLVLPNLLLLIKMRQNRKIERNGVFLEILVKKTSPAKQTESLIRNLHGLILNTRTRSLLHGNPWISFEISGTKKDIGFYFWIPKDYLSTFTERFYATYPECAINVLDEDYLPKTLGRSWRDYITYFKKKKTGVDWQLPRRVSVYGTEMNLAYHHVLPLNKNIDREDILDSILATMKNLESYDRVTLQILAKPIDGSWQHDARRILDKYSIDGVRPKKQSQMLGINIGGIKSQLSDEITEVLEHEMSDFRKTRKPSTKKSSYDRKEIIGATEKAFDVGFETIIRIAASSNYKKGAKEKVKSLSSAFTELNKENKLSRKIIFNRKRFYKKLLFRRIYLKPRYNILSAGELSKFFGRLPSEELIDNSQNIKKLLVKELAPPRFAVNDSFVIGENSYRGVKTMIGLKPKDLMRHMIVQGRTGTGKSEWAKTLMKQFADNGNGFALFEPHGKLAEETLEIIPKNRRKDVILFDLFEDYPPAFNFCKVRPILGRRIDEVIEKTAKEIIDINRRLFSEAWSGKNAYFLENAIKTVIELQNGNYVDIRRLFSDEHFRNYAIENIHDPQLKHFWRENFKMTKGSLSKGTESTVNSIDYKLGSFLNSKTLLRAVGQDDCIDFKDILDQNKILIFRFDKERMSEDQIAFIGGIAFKLLIVEAFRRKKQMWHVPFGIFVDEAQNYIDPTFKTVLYELRKYGVALIMMHQVLEQLDAVKGLRDAIYGNVGTIMSFTCGNPDASFFEKQFKPRVEGVDVENLPSRYAYCKLMVDGTTSDTFNLYSVDSPSVSREDAKLSKQEILNFNREGKKYYKEIDAALAKRLSGVPDFDEIKYDVVGDVNDDIAEDVVEAEKTAEKTSEDDTINLEHIRSIAELKSASVETAADGNQTLLGTPKKKTAEPAASVSSASETEKKMDNKSARKENEHTQNDDSQDYWGDWS